MRILGIDPGHSGAAGLIDTINKELVVSKLPVIREKRTKGYKSRIDAIEFARLVQIYKPDIAFIEDVFSMPTDGHVGAFTFGLGKGTLIGVLAALQIPTKFVAPMKWKSDLQLSSKKSTSIRLAHRLFPTHKKTLKSEGKCEAILIATWGALSLSENVKI